MGPADGLTLGPSLPLPLIFQDATLNISKIEEQPVDLTTLTARLMKTIITFTERFVNHPMLLYIATPRKKIDAFSFGTTDEFLTDKCRSRDCFHT